MKLDKKVVIVTGASRGIGRSISEYLSQKGCKVYGLARTEFESDKIISIACDITDSVALENVIKDIYAKEGEIFAIINNAGMGIAGAVELTSDEKIRKIFELNFIALDKACRICLPYLRESKGRIINISSVAAFMPIPFQTYYSATKSTVLTYSRALREEVFPFGVKVIAIMPGDTKTSFTSARETENNDSIYSKRLEKSLARMEKDEQNGKDPLSVAKVCYKVLKKKNPKPAIVVGGVYKLISLLDRILPKRLVNYIIRLMYAK